MTFSGENLACLRGERIVFQNLGFELRPGGMLLLLGANGSGKSTLLRLCAGFLRPFAGRLLYDGADIFSQRAEHRSRICYTGHLDALKAVMSVSENLLFWARLSGGDAQRLDEALDLFDLGGLADMPARFLSAGQRRRANLARLAMSRAPLWLLDEPTTALDKASCARLFDLMAAHRHAGGMIMVATHQEIEGADSAVLPLDDFSPVEAVF